MMKRYLLFQGARYYPSGGWWDFKDAFDTQEEAEREAAKLVEENDYDWWQVVDAVQMKVVVMCRYAAGEMPEIRRYA